MPSIGAADRRNKGGSEVSSELQLSPLDVAEEVNLQK